MNICFVTALHYISRVCLIQQYCSVNMNICARLLPFRIIFINFSHCFEALKEREGIQLVKSLAATNHNKNLS